MASSKHSLPGGLVSRAKVYDPLGDTEVMRLASETTRLADTALMRSMLGRNPALDSLTQTLSSVESFARLTTSPIATSNFDAMLRDIGKLASPVAGIEKLAPDYSHLVGGMIKSAPALSPMDMGKVAQAYAASLSVAATATKRYVAREVVPSVLADVTQPGIEEGAAWVSELSEVERARIAAALVGLIGAVLVYVKGALDRDAWTLAGGLLSIVVSVLVLYALVADTYDRE